MKLYLKQMAMFTVLFIVAGLMGLVDIPEQYMPQKVAWFVEYSIRCMMLVGFAVYYRWFLKTVGVINE